MTHFTKLFAFIPTIILLGACTQSYDEPEAKRANIPLESPKNAIGISPSTKDITAGEAMIVADIYKLNVNNSRSFSSASPMNVVTITNDDGVPTLYAVNYTDGYIIVSASKSSQPIQAIVEHGTFKLNDTPFGRDVVINELVESITYARNKNSIEDTKNSWLQYEKRVNEYVGEQSRAVDPDLTDARGDLRYELESQGYEVIRTWEETEGLPTSIINQFKEDINSRANEFYEETGQDADRAWLIAIKSESTFKEITPKLTTVWSQNDPYDLAVPGRKPLGCVTVAVAQLMRYYKKPAYFDWDSMPNKLESYAGFKPTTDPSQTNDSEGILVNFLALLRSQLKVNDNGGSNIDKALDVLKAYGYNASITTTPYENPCYTRGEDKKLDAGHAWIIDGTRTWDGYTEYILYFPSVAKYPEYVYTDINRQIKPDANIFHEYMNWGWGGTHNGWFRRDMIETPEGNFSSDRKYISISK